LPGNLENRSGLSNGGDEFDPNASINQRDISFGGAGQRRPARTQIGFSLQKVDSAADNQIDIGHGSVKIGKLNTELAQVEEEEPE